MTSDALSLCILEAEFICSICKKKRETKLPPVLKVFLAIGSCGLKSSSLLSSSSLSSELSETKLTTKVFDPFFHCLIFSFFPKLCSYLYMLQIYQLTYFQKMSSFITYFSTSLRNGDVNFFVYNHLVKKALF